jgi:hypothetical protein
MLAAAPRLAALAGFPWLAARGVGPWPPDLWEALVASWSVAVVFGCALTLVVGPVPLVRVKAPATPSRNANLLSRLLYIYWAAWVRVLPDEWPYLSLRSPRNPPGTPLGTQASATGQARREAAIRQRLA